VPEQATGGLEAISQTMLILLAKFARTLLETNAVTREDLTGWLGASEEHLRGAGYSIGLSFVTQLRVLLSVPANP
jgi:hypothetical protein